MDFNRRSSMLIAALALIILGPLFLVVMSAARHRGEEPAVTEKQQWAAVKVETAALYARIEQEFAHSGFLKSFPDLTLSANPDGAPTLHYHTTVCPVHRKDMVGSVSQVAVLEEGPIGDGLLLTFNACALSAVEQVVFVSGITPPPMAALSTSGAWVHQDHLEKLWYDYTCGVTIPDRKLRFFVIVLFNEQTSRPLLDGIYASIQRALAPEKLGDLDHRWY
jgi:hypothetical protein